MSSTTSEERKTKRGKKPIKTCDKCGKLCIDHPTSRQKRYGCPKPKKYEDLKDRWKAYREKNREEINARRRARAKEEREKKKMDFFFLEGGFEIVFEK